jgi:hypothetical protein
MRICSAHVKKCDVWLCILEDFKTSTQRLVLVKSSLDEADNKKRYAHCILLFLKNKYLECAGDPQTACAHGFSRWV